MLSARWTMRRARAAACCAAAAAALGLFAGEAGAARAAASAASVAPSLPVAMVGSAGASVAQGPLPVVSMHGLGDHSESEGMTKFRELASTLLGGVYSTSVRIGGDAAEDVANSFLMPLNRQVELYAEAVRADANLKGGFYAVGYSQGNLVVRGYIQRYNDPPVRRFASFHGPHGGVAGYPECNVTGVVCEEFARFLGELAYGELAQSHIAPANYLRDPDRVKAFVEGCTFLPDVNQMREVNATYKANVLSLERLLLVKAEKDLVIQPPDSAYFGYYEADQSSWRVVDGHADAVFKNDTLGLSTLEREGKLLYGTTPGGHMQWTEQQWTALFLRAFAGDISSGSV